MAGATRSEKIWRWLVPHYHVDLQVAYTTHFKVITNPEDPNFDLEKYLTTLDTK